MGSSSTSGPTFSGPRCARLSSRVDTATFDIHPDLLDRRVILRHEAELAGQHHLGGELVSQGFELSSGAAGPHSTRAKRHPEHWLAPCDHLSSVVVGEVGAKIFELDGHLTFQFTGFASGHFPLEGVSEELVYHSAVVRGIVQARGPGGVEITGDGAGGPRVFDDMNVHWIRAMAWATPWIRWFLPGCLRKSAARAEGHY